MTEDRSTGQFPARAGNLDFEKMLNEFADSVYHAGTQERVLPPYAVQEHQALIDYVRRLEARQITPEMEAVWDEYQVAHAKTIDEPDYLTLSGYASLKEALWRAFAVVMGEG